MPQTILAILAMMVATLFALQMNRHALRAQHRAVQNELVMQSTGVAEDMLGEIGAMSFDENTKTDAVGSSSELTAEAYFTGDAQGDDIDDFDGCCSEDKYRLIEDDTLWFNVDVRVSYAREDSTDEEVNYRTKVKKAEVNITSQAGISSDTITLARSYTCGGKCDW